MKPKKPRPKFKVGQRVRCVHGCGTFTIRDYDADWGLYFYTQDKTRERDTDLGHAECDLRHAPVCPVCRGEDVRWWWKSCPGRVIVWRCGYCGNKWESRRRR